jgi:hypothetical protein
VSLNRYAKARDVNEPEIVNGLRELGITVERLSTPCDLVCGWLGKNCLIEVKDGRKKPLTPKQRDFVSEWKGQITVATTLQEAVWAVILTCGPVPAWDGPLPSG